MPKCKNAVCKKPFKRVRSNQIVCSPGCAYAYTKQKKTKEWNKEKAKRKKALKTTQDYLKELQLIFNRYIRTRDYGQPCISCGKLHGVKMTAGHFYTVGSYPNLRFNPDNVHGQCWYNCNKNKHGNLSEYLPNLIAKIGQDNFNALEAKRNEPLNLSIQEIEELKRKYKELIKQLEKEKGL